MKVELQIYPQGGISCLTDKCPFARECANHRTAGDYRYEDGFTPELDKEGDDFVCHTADRGVYDDSKFWSQYADLPDNYETLGRGSMSYKRLLKKTVHDYQI